LITLYNFPTSN